jgi:acetyl-CoA acetyltransferase
VSLRGRTAVIGYGEADLQRVPGRSGLHFAAQAARRAIVDAGIDKSEIDGLFTSYAVTEPYPFYSGTLAEYLQIVPTVHAAIGTGGSAFAQSLAQAAAAVASGFCRTALVVHGDNRASGMTREQMIALAARGAGHPDFESPYGPMVPSFYALVASRHMAEFGTRPEHLAQVAVSHRKHAALNENAIMRSPLTLEQALASKPVSDPLRVSDCCLVSDFGGALIVTSAERARDHRHPPVYLLGAGEGLEYEYLCQFRDLTSSAARLAGRKAYEMAGLTPADMQFAQLYDCFTITVLVTLEDLGFCAKGESGAFVEGGSNIELGGRLPVNTHGGLLSCANGGILGLVEAVRQLRHEAGDRQLKDARTGLVNSQGGILSSHCTVILGRDL